ncbi:hypothetical protein [Neisseria sp. Ec49-e6-T10]|uniref:hypothetical protein n=1 Tax=Neisseria sp. Ec49-e6-T10 TaxID=3140744 RepID=UPI003EBE2EA8
MALEKILSWINKRINGEEIPLDIPAQHQDLGSIFLEEAIVFHVNWRMRWLDTLSKSQNLNPDEVCLDHICEVGK